MKIPPGKPSLEMIQAEFQRLRPCEQFMLLLSDVCAVYETVGIDPLNGNREDFVELMEQVVERNGRTPEQLRDFFYKMLNDFEEEPRTDSWLL
jgi:hypothetical protein